MKGKVELALGRAVRDAKLASKSDAAAVALATKYAQVIDADLEPLAKVGKGLLDTLVELGLTPKARASVMKGQAPATSGLDELRARRERRA